MKTRFRKSRIMRFAHRIAADIEHKNEKKGCDFRE